MRSCVTREFNRRTVALAFGGPDPRNTGAVGGETGARVTTGSKGIKDCGGEKRCHVSPTRGHASGLRSDWGGEGGGVFFFFSRGDGEDEAEVLGECKVDFGARLYPALRLTAIVHARLSQRYLAHSRVLGVWVIFGGLYSGPAADACLIS